jgi:general secretion pathway protein K
MGSDLINNYIKKMKIRGQKGIALITTLLILVLLIGITVEFNRMSIADIQVAQNYGNSKKALYISLSGLNAIKQLLTLDAIYSKVDTLLEPWAQIEPFVESANSALEEGRIDIRVSDESGKLPVNMLVDGKGRFNPVFREIWERFLSDPRFALTEAQVYTILESIKDWLDPDDDVTGLYGAEDAFYIERGYGCKNGPITYINEMLLIKGIDKSIFYGDEYREGIRQYITPYGSGKININTAPIPVLMALSDNMNLEKAEELDSFRRDPANKDILQGIAWYRNMWPFENPLPEKVLTSVSDCFMVSITGTVEESKKRINAVLKRSKNKTQVIYWEEDR